MVHRTLPAECCEFPVGEKGYLFTCVSNEVGKEIEFDLAEPLRHSCGPTRVLVRAEDIAIGRAAVLCCNVLGAANHNIRAEQWQTISVVFL